MGCEQASVAASRSREAPSARACACPGAKVGLEYAGSGQPVCLTGLLACATTGGVGGNRLRRAAIWQRTLAPDTSGAVCGRIEQASKATRAPCDARATRQQADFATLVIVAGKFCGDCPGFGCCLEEARR